MTHSEKLNRLLHVLLWTHRKVLTNQPVSTNITFTWLCKTVAEVTEEWEIEFIKQRLLTDGYIKMGDFGDGEPPVLTPTGIKFIQSGGYTREAKERELEQQIKEQTLKSLKRSNTALKISILAIVIPTLISLCGLWISKQLATTEDLQKMQQRIEKLEHSKSEAKIISNALEIKSVDTLKKLTNHK